MVGGGEGSDGGGGAWKLCGPDGSLVRTVAVAA
jgi:hypothetical protein